MCVYIYIYIACIARQTRRGCRSGWPAKGQNVGRATPSFLRFFEKLVI